MNNRERKTITASSAGHEGHGALVCHRCGWTFPNPHPSAKNRRAHKKICGTIEGYKILQSEVDNDTHIAITVNEHSSDENGRRPGHEGHGVRTCHRCGWPFPNPHPSAKNRRAHRKICGAIEGYKVLQSVIDDDTHFAITVNEHASDENGHSPCTDAIELLNDTASMHDAIAQINANSPSEHVVHLTNNAAQTVNASTLVGLRDFAQPHLIKDDNTLGSDTVKSGDEISEPALLAVEGKEKPCDHFKLDVSPRTDDSDKTVNSADEQVFISASDLTRSIETPEKVLAEEAREYSKASVASTSLNNSDAESTFETNNGAIESLNSDGLVYISEHDSDIVASDGTLEHPPPSSKEAMPISSESIDDAAEVRNEIRNGHVDNFSKENVNLDLASSTVQETLPENKRCSNEAFTDAKAHQGDDADAVSTSLQDQEPSPLNLEDSQEICLTGHDKITDNGEENLDMIVSGTKPSSPEATLNISNKELKAKDIEAQPIKSEVFETPFIEYLTQPSGEIYLETGSPEIEALTGNHQSKSNYLQASVFPSLTNVASESEGIRINEEIIAKVTNSNPETQHSSLRTLLDEDKTSNTKQNQKEDDESKDDAACSAAVKSILIEETVKDQESNKDIKEVDSPARYTIVDKKQKKKKMKSYRFPFMCCSSVHGDS